MKFPMVMRVTRTKLHEGESEVRSGLAYSPADMQKLTLANKSIVSTALESFARYDNLPNDAEVPIAERRGVDDNVLWENACDTREKLRAFKKKQQQEHKTESI